VPDLLENKLRFEAKKRYPNDEERQNAHVKDTLRRRGWTPKEEKK
jgi:hypothetical protein